MSAQTIEPVIAATQNSLSAEEVLLLLCFVHDYLQGSNLHPRASEKSLSIETALALCLHDPELIQCTRINADLLALRKEFSQLKLSLTPSHPIPSVTDAFFNLWEAQLSRVKAEEKLFFDSGKTVLKDFERIFLFLEGEKPYQPKLAETPFAFSMARFAIRDDILKALEFAAALLQYLGYHLSPQTIEKRVSHLSHAQSKTEESIPVMVKAQKLDVPKSDLPIEVLVKKIQERFIFLSATLMAYRVQSENQLAYYLLINWAPDGRVTYKKFDDKENAELANVIEEKIKTNGVFSEAEKQLCFSQLNLTRQETLTHYILKRYLWLHISKEQIKSDFIDFEQALRALIDEGHNFEASAQQKMVEANQKKEQALRRAIEVFWEEAYYFYRLCHFYFPASPYHQDLQLKQVALAMRWQDHADYFAYTFAYLEELETLLNQRLQVLDTALKPLNSQYVKAHQLRVAFAACLFIFALLATVGSIGLVVTAFFFISSFLIYFGCFMGGMIGSIGFLSLSVLAGAYLIVAVSDKAQQKNTASDLNYFLERIFFSEKPGLLEEKNKIESYLFSENGLAEKKLCCQSAFLFFSKGTKQTLPTITEVQEATENLSLTAS